MHARLAAMREDVVVLAAGLLQRVGQDRHRGEVPLVVHLRRDADGRLGELLGQLNCSGVRPDAVVFTGDLADKGEPAAYRKLRDLVEPFAADLGAELIWVMGNHDERHGFQTLLLGQRATSEKHFYERELNGVQFLFLDSNAPAPFAGGALGKIQLEWLKDICNARDPRPLAIGVHHNALPIGSPFWDEFMRMRDGEEFHTVIKAALGRLRGVFFGHVHQSSETYRDGVMYVSVPSTWYQLHCYPGQSGILQDIDAEPGFNVVSITETQTFIRRHRFRVPEHRRPS